MFKAIKKIRAVKVDKITHYVFYCGNNLLKIQLKNEIGSVIYLREYTTQLFEKLP